MLKKKKKKKVHFKVEIYNIDHALLIHKMTFPQLHSWTTFRPK